MISGIGCTPVAHLARGPPHHHQSEASIGRLFEVGGTGRIGADRCSGAARIECHAVISKCQGNDIGMGVQHDFDLSLARRPHAVTHDVGNNLLEDEFDTETQVGTQAAAIERVAQRGETLLKTRQRPGETQPGGVSVDAAFLRARLSLPQPAQTRYQPSRG